MAEKKSPNKFFPKTIGKLIDRQARQYVAIAGTSIVAYGKNAHHVYEGAREIHSHERILIACLKQTSTERRSIGREVLECR